MIEHQFVVERWDARRLRHLPRIWAAVITGAMTAWHARTVADACSDPTRLGLMTESEGEFIDRAEQLDGRGFDSAVRYWEEINFAADAAARAAAADEQRHVSLVRTFEGILHMGGSLHPLYGTVVADELKRLEG